MLSRINLMRILRKPDFTLLRHSSNGSHTVLMRGLDFETTEEDVIQFFKPLGITPTKVHLRCDGSGRTAAFSEVEFNTHAEAVVALRKKNAFIGNKFIRLTLKSSDSETKTTEVEVQNIQSSSKVALAVDDKKKAVESLHHAGYFIRMKNMPLRITDQDIFEFFWPVGARPISVQPLYNENGFRTGEFDVHFLSDEDVQKAVSKNNAYLRNKYVHLSMKQS